VLVIGGGFAGASLAVKLAGNQDIDLTLVSR
jgi:NADH dehydrogenase FAD-containing subunit